MRSKRLRFAALALVGILASGCLAATNEKNVETPDVTAPPVTHVLAGAIEPTEFAAPTFKLIGAVARAGPPGGNGEPSVWAHLDGTLYLSFPGCDNGNEPPATPLTPRSVCRHGPVYRSDDAGSSWKKLNKAPEGRLTPAGAAGGPNANGDAEVTVDAAGNVYASNLGANGIQMWSSPDRGDTWRYLGNATPRRHWADRQWLAAASAGHVIATWMGGKNPDPGGASQRAVAINVTFDGGDTWTGVMYVGQGIGWLGPVAFHPTDETLAYIPYTQPDGPAQQGAPRTFTLWLAKTVDGGRTWDAIDTKTKVRASGTGGHWSGVHMAPALDVTGDGTVVYAWSEDVLDATGATSTGARVRLVASRDDGVTWTPPTTVSTRTAAIMPWVTGGAGDRAAINYYASDLPLDTDYVGRWDVQVAVVDGVADAAPKIQNVVLDRDVHYGGLCSRGTGCAPPSDRTLLDFFESDLLPDGRLVVSYGADPHTQGKYAQIRVAVQNGGTPLLAR